METLEQLITAAIVDNYRDHSFNYVYPNSKAVMAPVFAAETAELIALHVATTAKIKTWCSTVGSRISVGFITAEFTDPNYPNNQSPYRHYVHGLHATLAVEIDIRQHYEFLIQQLEVTNVEFYEKQNWGKCVLFTYKGKRLMAAGDEYFYHNATEYSLDGAKPRFATRYKSQY